MIDRIDPTPLGRVLIVSLALIANLFAAGTPVLHAWTHHREGDDHHAPVVELQVDHDHEAEHPRSLHDDTLVVKRHALDLTFLHATPGVESVVVATECIRVRPTVASLGSRAPPPGDPARAPPLA